MGSRTMLHSTCRVRSASSPITIQRGSKLDQEPLVALARVASQGASAVSVDRRVLAHTVRRLDAALAFGAGLRCTRLGRGITQMSLAEAGGFDVSFISLLERGRRTPTFLAIVRLAEALEVSPIKLFAEGVARLPGEGAPSALYRLAYRKMDHLLEVGPGYPDLAALAHARAVCGAAEPTHIIEYIHASVIELPKTTT